MKKVIVLYLLMNSHVAVADINDFFLKFAQLSVDDMLRELNEPPSPFTAYCELIDVINEFKADLADEQNELKMSEAECRRRVLSNQEKCSVKLSSKKTNTYSPRAGAIGG